MYVCLLTPGHLGETACIHHRFELACLSVGVGRSILYILVTLYTMQVPINVDGLDEQDSLLACCPPP